MNNYQNFLAGKDWIITISIPNKLLIKHSREVQWLQIVIETELRKFNAEIKKLEGEAAEASLRTPQDGDKGITEEEKQAIVIKMEKDRKDREGGGGRENL